MKLTTLFSAILLSFSFMACERPNPPRADSERDTPAETNSTIDAGAAGNAQSNATANPKLETNTASNINSANSYEPGQRNQALDTADPDPEANQKSGGATGAVSIDSGAQKESGADRSQLTQNTSRNVQESRLVGLVQAEIAKDKTLSSQAQKTQVRSQNGQIYLSGTAANEAERKKLETLAKFAAGNNTVVNEVTVQK